MKILVVYTGGTIASTDCNGYLSPSEGTAGELIKRYNRINNGDICFEEMSPFNILSENLSASALNGIIDTVCDMAHKGYDGIIVTHGTDTMQYTACALSLALGDSIPVVLVSSAYPLSDSRANGFDNFEAAVRFIEDGAGRGVFVSYKNSGEVTRLHRGERAMLHGDYTDSVESLFGEAYAEYADDEIRVLAPSQKAPKALGALNLDESSGVLCINAMPADGFSYSLDGIKAVIIRAYHSGTLNTGSPRLIDFCKRASALDIPVYAYNCPEGNAYESERAYDLLGIKRLPMCTLAYAYIMLWRDSRAFGC